MTLHIPWLSNSEYFLIEKLGWCAAFPEVGRINNFATIGSLLFYICFRGGWGDVLLTLACCATLRK